MSNTQYINVVTDEQIISNANSKSHLNIGCFGLDEGTGAVLADKFGNQDSVSLNGAPTWNSGTAGHPDGYAEFDATTTTAFYNTPGTEAPKATHTALFKTKDIGTGSLIVNLWIWSPTIDPTGQEYIMSFGDSTAGNGWYGIFQDATNMKFRYDDGTTQTDINVVNTLLSNSTWHMVTVTMDSSAISIYLDGSSSAVDSLASPNLIVDPADNTNTTRALHLFCNGAGGGSSFKTGSSTRTVYLSKLLAIKSTANQTANYAQLLADLYRVGPGRIAPAIADL